MKLAYITNTTLTESSGGGSGVNFATHQRLNNFFDIEDVEVIVPAADFRAKLQSVLLKKIGVKRNYHAFSEARLMDVQRKFKAFEENCNVDFFYFHGFTQWIKTKPSKPYFCFNDACFATYVEIFNNKIEFSEKDLNRIYSQEKEWLKNARLVFFRSQWALEETKKAYGLQGDNFINIGVGGFIDIPNKDSYRIGEKKSFLFISREFIPKGGKRVVEAFQKLSKFNKNISLSIVGDDPGDEIKNIENVNYLGFFNKQKPEDYQKLLSIFSNTFALIHPTIKDTNTLVVLELSYFGCPVIASNKFAIPEYLIDQKSGYLINDPMDVDEIASLMEQLIIKDDKAYVSMRKFTRENAIGNNTWDHVVNKMIGAIVQALN